MSRVYVQVIGNDIEQHCTIEEPVNENNLVNNALLRFGLKESDIEWQRDTYPTEEAVVKCGNVIGGNKIVIVTVNKF